MTAVAAAPHCSVVLRFGAMPRLTTPSFNLRCLAPRMDAMLITCCVAPTHLLHKLPVVQVGAEEPRQQGTAVEPVQERRER